MFDKLIVSEPAGADLHNRRSYFMVSSLIVGILFLAAVVFSIYASDYGLGSDSFELSMVIAPIENAAAEPESPKPQPQPQQVQPTIRTEQPMRQVDMPRVDEIGPVPSEISTVPNSTLARPNGDFRIGPVDTNPAIGNPIGPPATNPPVVVAPEPVAPRPETKPQPVAPDPPKPAPLKSGGVVNGLAKNLPMPIYPPSAKLMRISGVVEVQVLIDESGKVIAAKAVAGQPILRQAAEKAAHEAHFSTTTLSGQPVKVSGIIVYNFKL